MNPAHSFLRIFFTSPQEKIEASVPLEDPKKGARIARMHVPAHRGPHRTRKNIGTTESHPETTKPTSLPPFEPSASTRWTKKSSQTKLATTVVMDERMVFFLPRTPCHEFSCSPGHCATKARPRPLWGQPEPKTHEKRKFLCLCLDLRGARCGAHGEIILAMGWIRCDHW